MFIIFTFSFIFHILGIEVPNRDADYPYLGHYSVYFLMVFRSAVGDVHAPAYAFWQGAEESGHPRVSFLMIYFIWVVWFVSMVFNLVIFLNFMISIIS